MSVDAATVLKPFQTFSIDVYQDLETFVIMTSGFKRVFVEGSLYFLAATCQHVGHSSIGGRLGFGIFKK